MLRAHSACCFGMFLLAVSGFLIQGAEAEPAAGSPAAASATKNAKASANQAEREVAFAKILSGATLEGNFTSTGKGNDGKKLSSDKYTLGEVKKVQGNYWMIPARIQYGDKDMTIPLMLPVQWAGDTPVIVVDDVGLPGFGSVSARVMFFADHYAGYWKHGEHGGHLFGTITRDEKEKEGGGTEAAKTDGSGDPSGGQKAEK